MILSYTRRVLRTGAGTCLLLLASAGFAFAQTAGSEVKCTYTKRSVCSIDGCKDTNIGSNHLLTPSFAAMRASVEASAPFRVQRCDDLECTPVEIDNSAEGGFLTLSGLGGSYMIKVYDGPPLEGIELQTGDFIEVITSMMTTFVAYGRCTPVQP